MVAVDNIGSLLLLYRFNNFLTKKKITIFAQKIFSVRPASGQGVEGAKERKRLAREP
jgi:hypothetical protein